MNHFVLFAICVLSIEILVRFNFLSVLNSIVRISKRVVYVIPRKNISDHWKEKVIPLYALVIMNLSIRLILIPVFIISSFLVSDLFFDHFIDFTFSYVGIAEAIIFSSLYGLIRKLNRT